MLYRRKGMPAEDELVLCTVTNIQHNSVFVQLDEYDKGGMIHISEIAPGRIRNIRDFVKEGKKVVCKILRVDPVKGYIDLSLRRVNEGQRRAKTNQIKLEQKAEKVLEFLARSQGEDVKKIYNAVASKVFVKYSWLHECFKDIVEDKVKLEELGIEKSIAKSLTDIVLEKMRPEEVSVRGELVIKSYAPDGVEVVKEALAKAIASGKKAISILYKGSGKYDITVKSTDYKSAEKMIKSSADAAVEFITKMKGIGSFEREAK